jgi:hypothetical protein
MLHEDFNTACRLLHDMAVHPELQVDHAPTHPFKYKGIFYNNLKLILFISELRLIVYVHVIMKVVGFVVVYYKYHLIFQRPQLFIWIGA